MMTGSSRALFAKYAIPQMVGLLFNSIYLIVDGLFIGNVLGREAMAAAAVAVPFIEILMALSMAVASGAGILIASRLGQGEIAPAQRAFQLAVFLLAALGLLVMALGNLFIDPLARALGSTPEIHADAVAYLRMIVTFSPFLLFSFLLGGLVRNDGNPKLAMFALAFGSVSNIVLDYVFMVPLNMGITGAALATALGPIFSVLILLPHFLLKKGKLRLQRGKTGIGDLKPILALGFPSFIMEFTIGIITFATNIAIVRNGFGEIGLAAYLVIGYLSLIFLTLFLGLAEGLQPVFSHFAGTGEAERSDTLLAFSIKVFLAVGALCFGLIALFGGRFIALFSPGDGALIDFARHRVFSYFCGFPLAGYTILMISCWQSRGQARPALIASLARSAALPPLLMAVLPIVFGPESIWICHSISEIASAGVALALALRMRGGPRYALARGRGEQRM